MDSLGSFRVVRVPLSVEAIQEIDRLVERKVGGFESRAELIKEAVDAYIIELKYGPAELTVPSHAQEIVKNRLGDGPAAHPAPTLDEGRYFPLGAPPKCLAFNGDALVEGGPLFFHNRDYPSLWAAHAIAELTQDGPIAFDACVRKVTDKAWRFAAGLKNVPSSAIKPTALFPTNPDKKEASEAAFQAFAIGTAVREDNRVRANGPLFVWKMLEAKLEDGKIIVGLSKDGRSLLERLSRVSASMPHGRDLATDFLGYLQEHAKEDHWGFLTVTKIAAENPNRDQLIKEFGIESARRGYNWTTHQVSNYATGYVSRCREWGLIEPKQIDGRYALTDFGRSAFKEAA